MSKKSVSDLQKELNTLTSFTVEKEKQLKTLAAEKERAELLRVQIEKQIEEAEKEAGEDLETKFAATQQTVLAEINKHLEAAKAEMKKAFALSEQSGIPFESSIVDLSKYTDLNAKFDIFVPKTFAQNWEALYEECGIADFLYDSFGAGPYYNAYGDNDFDHGYCIAWAPSSMRC